MDGRSSASRDIDGRGNSVVAFCIGVRQAVCTINPTHDPRRTTVSREEKVTDVQ